MIFKKWQKTACWDGKISTQTTGNMLEIRASKSKKQALSSEGKHGLHSHTSSLPSAERKVHERTQRGKRCLIQNKTETGYLFVYWIMVFNSFVHCQELLTRVDICINLLKRAVMKELKKNELRHWIKTSLSLAVVASHNQNKSVFLVSFLP